MQEKTILNKHLFFVRTEGDIKIKGGRKKHEKLNKGTLLFLRLGKVNKNKMSGNFIYLSKCDSARSSFLSIFEFFE